MAACTMTFSDRADGAVNVDLKWEPEIAADAEEFTPAQQSAAHCVDFLMNKYKCDENPEEA